MPGLFVHDRATITGLRVSGCERFVRARLQSCRHRRRINEALAAEVSSHHPKMRTLSRIASPHALEWKQGIAEEFASADT